MNFRIPMSKRPRRHPLGMALPIFFAVLLTSLGAAAEIPLGGTWRFTTDPGDKGIAASWWRSPDAFADTIHLPGTTGLAGKGQRRTAAPDGDLYLTREFDWVGPAWYQREIDIPESWLGRRVELVLERVMWQSRVWLDGREVSPPGDALSVPHAHWLGRVGADIEPGMRRLTLRIDNRMIHPIGDKGHGYGDQMQGVWNGAVGRIALRAIAPGEVLHARIFPDAAKQQLRAGLRLEPTTDGTRATGTILMFDPDGREVAQARWQAEAGAGQHEITLQLAKVPKLWSEFEQPLYQIEIRPDVAEGAASAVRERIGFRQITRAGHRVAVNGQLAFFRGNSECAAFPLIGHPPVDIESWRRIWRVYREHNLNHARFHSWCPPRAAFEAADESGIYLQIEAPFWMDRWMSRPNKRPEMETAGLRAENDQILNLAGDFSYTVDGDGAWRDDSGSAWLGKRLRIVLKIRGGVPGTLHLRFHDWDHKGRRGSVTIEGETLDLPDHAEARWIRFPIIREHTNDGRILIDAAATAGPNLMLTDLAFVPEK